MGTYNEDADEVVLGLTSDEAQETKDDFELIINNKNIGASIYAQIFA